MKNYKNILLKPTSSIKEALKIIDSGAMQIALVIDKNEKLLGTLTDGDIRRGLLNNLTLDDSIESIIFKNPTVCNIEDTKEEILDIAVTKKIYQIPIVNNAGKLVGVEELDELIKAKTKTNKVVLMVGGLGTRLRPLTEHTPKPMLKVGDKPILETIILNFKKYGFSNIVLCVSYKSEIIEDYFGDGANFGVNIEYIFGLMIVVTVAIITPAFSAPLGAIVTLFTAGFLIGVGWLPLNYQTLLILGSLVVLQLLVWRKVAI